MSELNYNEIAQTIIENVGGIKNIAECYHCQSRLRVKVRDTAKVNLDEIRKLKFNGAILNNDQLQIIAGDKIYSLYDAMSAALPEDLSLGEMDLVQEAKHQKMTVKSLFFSFFGGLSNSVLPNIPIMIATGVLKGLIIALAAIGIMDNTSQTYAILDFACDAMFYFLPIWVGFNCAKNYGGSPLMGALLGAVLLHPTFTGLVSAGEPLKLFGLPVRLVSYSSSVLPAFVSVWLMCKVEKLMQKYVPDKLKVILVPFLTFAIMLPLTLIVLAPIGAYLSDILGKFFAAIYTAAGPFAPAIVACLIPYLVMTGTHLTLGALAIPILFSTGAEYVMMPGALVHNITHAALSLAVGLKTKNSELKGTALSASFTAFMAGISEPSLFGIFARFKSAMIALTIGQFAAGLYFGITHTGIHMLTGGGPAFMSVVNFSGGPTSDFTNAIIGYALGSIVTFVIAFLLYNDKKEGMEVKE